MVERLNTESEEKNRQDTKGANIGVFLDRDGTLNRNVPYCSRPEELELLPTVAEGIKLLNQHGLKVVIVTNQSGIARGYFTEHMLQAIHRKLRDDLARAGAFVDAIYYCPHHPDEQCRCRKPNPGLLYLAASELQIDLASSYIIGDRLVDIVAAKNVGCKAVLVPSSDTEIGVTGNGQVSAEGIDFTSPDFYTAAAWIIDQQKKTGGALY